MSKTIQKLSYLYVFLTILYFATLYNPSFLKNFYKTQLNLLSSFNLFEISNINILKENHSKLMNKVFYEKLDYFPFFNISMTEIDFKPQKEINKIIFNSEYENLPPERKDKSLALLNSNRTLALFEAPSYNISSNEVTSTSHVLEKTINHTKELIKEKKYLSAENLLLNLISQNPNNYDLKTLLSTVYIKTERFSEAKQLFKETKKIEYQKGAPKMVFLKKTANLLISSKIKKLESLKEYSPQKKEVKNKNTKKTVSLAKIKKHSKNKPKEDEGKKTFKVSPSSKTQLKKEDDFNEALSHIQQGNYILAKNLLYKNLKKQKTDTKSRVKLVEVLIKMKKIKEAQEILISGINAEPKNVDLKLQLANLHISSNNYNTALNILNNIPLQEQKKIKFASIVANVHLNLKNYSTSEDLYKKLLKHDPTNHSWLLGLALSYEGNKNYNKALVVFNKMQTLNIPTNIRNYINNKKSSLSQVR